jgi:nitrous oxide reductase accessory protein NosL
MNSTTVYAVRWQNLWWCGREFSEGNVDRLGSIMLKDARFFSDEELAEDVAKELGGQVKRVDLITE